MPKDKNAGRQTVKSVTQDPKSPIHALSQNPEVAAVASKATTNPNPNGIDISTRSGTFAVNQAGMYEIANQVGQNRRDGENILQLFPDIELAMQVLVSSTLSPKDMKTVDLIFGNEENRFIPANVSAMLTTLVKTEIEKVYGLSEDQDRILNEALFKIGAHVRVVIPESSLDDMIHGREFDVAEKLKISFESDQGGSIDLSRSKGLGILASNESVVNPVDQARRTLSRLLSGSTTTVPNENANLLAHTFGDEVVYDPLVEFTDNFDTLKLPELTKKIVQENMRQIYRGKRRRHVVGESSGGQATIARRAHDSAVNMALARTRDMSSRQSIGRPLVLEVPPESIMVIHTPGRPSEHRAYIALTDMEGNFLDLTKTYHTGITGSGNQTFATSLGNSVSNPVNLNTQNNGAGSAILERAAQHLKGTSSDNVVHIPDLERLFGSILEENIARRINAGLSGPDIEFAEQNEFYRLMLSRALAGRYTRMVFLPKELVTYYAFNYYDNGVGKSYFDNVKILCQHRAAMLYSDVIGHVKSTIPITRVNVKIGEDDPDPWRTISTAMQEVMLTRNDILPRGLSHAEMGTWAVRQSMEFNFEDHPRLPDTRLDFETKRLERSSSDNTISEDLRKQTIMAFGLNPDQVDAGMQVEFATSLQQSNLMLSKHTARIGAKLSIHNTHYVKSLLENDMVIRARLREIVKENVQLIREFQVKAQDLPDMTSLSDEVFIEEMVDTYIETIKLSLPQPDGNSIEILKEAFATQKEAYTEAIEQFIGSDLITSELVGEVAGNIELLKQVLLSELMRKWMADNGYLTEVADLFATDETNQLRTDQLSSAGTHIKTAVTMLLKFVGDMKTFKEAADKDVETVGLSGGSSDYGSSDDTDGGDTGAEGGDEDLGDAPPNLDDPSLDPDAGGTDGDEVGGEEEGDKPDSETNNFDPDSLD